MNEIEKEKNLMQSNKDIEIENEKVAEVLLEQKSGEKLDAQKVDSSDSDKNEASDAEKKIETMQVMIHPIPQKNRSTFEAMIQNLLVMHEEIENKQNLAHEQNRVIGERISLLVQKYDIEVNRSHYEHFVKSIATYMQLLHDILREFRDEVLLCRYVFALEEPKLYEMPINIDLESYKWFLGHDALTEEEINFLLLGKIQQVKRHIKTVKKDLRVSFSRYLYGFDAQMKQVERIELSMRYSKANEQQVAEATVKQAVDNNVESQVSEGAV